MARNEMLFRDLNEQVEFVANRLDSDPHTFEFFCECADVDCTLRLPMALAVYEEVRSDPTLFVVAPGHERREIEEVLRQTDGYQVVRKKGRQRTSPQRKTRAADSRRAFRHCPGPVYGASMSQDEAQAAFAARLRRLQPLAGGIAAAAKGDCPGGRGAARTVLPHRGRRGAEDRSRMRTGASVFTPGSYVADPGFTRSRNIVV
jgi:hypothetical protein